MWAALCWEYHHGWVAVEQCAWGEVHAFTHLNTLYAADVPVSSQRRDNNELIWSHVCLHTVASLVHHTANLQSSKHKATETQKAE